MTVSISLKSLILGVIAAGFVAYAAIPEPAQARTNNNFASTSRSQQCSLTAQRYADRHVRRRTARGAAAGGAIGGVVGGNRRGAGQGALIGGGAQLFHANSRWRTYYNRRYDRCINS